MAQKLSTQQKLVEDGTYIPIVSELLRLVWQIDFWRNWTKPTSDQQRQLTYGQYNQRSIVEVECLQLATAVFKRKISQDTLNKIFSHMLNKINSIFYVLLLYVVHKILFKILFAFYGIIFLPRNSQEPDHSSAFFYLYMTNTDNEGRYR